MNNVNSYNVAEGRI